MSTPQVTETKVEEIRTLKDLLERLASVDVGKSELPVLDHTEKKWGVGPGLVQYENVGTISPELLRLYVLVEQIGLGSNNIKFVEDLSLALLYGGLLKIFHSLLLSELPEMFDVIHNEGVSSSYRKHFFIHQGGVVVVVSTERPDGDGYA